MAQAIFFETPEQWRAWLAEHGADATEVLVGFHKKGTGRPSITWPESVDQALCFGWIDGIRRGLDAESYTIRFTPRKPTSNWSAVNIRRMQELIDQGLVHPAGLRAFERRRDDRSAIYSYEQRRAATLPPEYVRQLRANSAAWEFFRAQAPSYQRTAIYWVVSAKREETRKRRLATLIDDSAHGRRIAPLAAPRRS
ncbi:MAG: YdeI/OmpD-associated family protein [Micromonosporaceae bacterium]